MSWTCRSRAYWSLVGWSFLHGRWRHVCHSTPASGVARARGSMLFQGQTAACIWLLWTDQETKVVPMCRKRRTCKSIPKGVNTFVTRKKHTWLDVPKAGVQWVRGVNYIRFLFIYVSMFTCRTKPFIHKYKDKITICRLKPCNHEFGSV